MVVICFDLGGTLIDDPFPYVLDILEKENWEYDYSFANHMWGEKFDKYVRKLSAL